MRVICIDDKTRAGHCTLKYGETYTVESQDGCGSGCCYGIAETKQAHMKDRFIPLSEIDETTFERNYKKELV